jgi:hypothetical protein
MPRPGSVWLTCGCVHNEMFRGRDTRLIRSVGFLHQKSGCHNLAKVEAEYAGSVNVSDDLSRSGTRLASEGFWHVACTDRLHRGLIGRDQVLEQGQVPSS